MPAKEVFEELGILDAPMPVNPLETIGISKELAAELLTEDPTGQSLRLASSGLHRALVQLYHPDKPNHNVDRFQAVTDANQQIQEAAVSSIMRWSRKVESAGQKEVNATREEQVKVVTRGSKLLREIFSGVDTSESYIHFPKSHGLVVQNDSGNHLIKHESDINSSSITNCNSIVGLGEDPYMRYDDIARQDVIEDFIIEDAQHKGYTPSDVSHIFVNGRGNILMYSRDSEVISDAGDTQASRQAEHERTKGTKDEDKNYMSYSNYDFRSSEPRLLNLTFNKRHGLAGVRVLDFAAKRGYGNETVRKVFKKPFGYEVIGSLEGEVFMNKLRGMIGQSLYRPIDTSEKAKEFPLVLRSFTEKELFTIDSSYTPKLDHGNYLVLRDPKSNLLIATEARIASFLRSSD